VRHIINDRQALPDEKLLQGFRELLKVYSPSCILADTMERTGVLPSSIRPVVSGRFVGPALTVRLDPGDLVDCLDALKVAQAGDVIIVDAAEETETSIWGGLMTGLAQKRGVVGAVVNGAVRDVDEVKDLGFPLYARAVTPRSTHSPFSGRLEPIEVNVDITVGQVIVRPGDIVLADEVGVVVVPLAKAQDVLAQAQAQAEKEERTREWIKQDKTVDELLKEFGRL